MDPRELKNDDQWRELLEKVSEETGMAAALTNGDGGVLIEVGERFELCRTIRAKPEALTFICAQSSSAMLAEVRQSSQPVVDECDGGLLRMALPVLHQGQLVGQVVACGVKGEEVDAFLVSKQVGISEAEAEELAERSPIGNEAELEALATRWTALINE